MGIMYGLKIEEKGGKECIMWSFIIYTVCQLLGYRIKVAKWDEGNLEKIFDWKQVGKSLFRRSV